MLKLPAHEFLPTLQMGKRLHFSCGKAGKDGGEACEQRVDKMNGLRGLQNARHWAYIFLAERHLAWNEKST
jgi:hypothetical protein